MKKAILMRGTPIAFPFMSFLVICGQLARACVGVMPISTRTVGAHEVSLKDKHGKRVSIAGIIIEDRIHRQEDGRPMKFISVCDATGIIECELFADTYRRFGIETIRNPVVEIVGKVVPFANGNGHTLQVQRVAKARSIG